MDQRKMVEVAPRTAEKSEEFWQPMVGQGMVGGIKIQNGPFLRLLEWNLFVMFSL